MVRGEILDLADCSTVRRSLAARAPRFARRTALLLIILLVVVVVWGSFAQTNVVVRAAGQVRPGAAPVRVLAPTAGELDGRVISAPFAEGDPVHAGEVVVRLDATHLDNQITKLEAALQTSADEIAKIRGLESLINEQLVASTDKAKAEVAQAVEAVSRLADRRSSELRIAEAFLKAAADHWQRMSKMNSRAVSAEDVVRAEVELRQAEERVVQAKLPVEDTLVTVARRAVELVEREFAIRRAEIQARLVAKQAETDAGRKELVNLKTQRAAAELRSPIDGVVVASRIRPGDILQRGAPALEIAPLGDYRFEAVVPSDNASDLRVGMPVRVKFDSAGVQATSALDGTIVDVSPVPNPAGADERGPKSGETAAASQCTVTHVVRIELRGARPSQAAVNNRIKLGLRGTAEIVTGRESILSSLIRHFR